MLSGTERWWLVQAVALLPLNALAFRALGLRRWQRILTGLMWASNVGGSSAGAASFAANLAQANRLAGIVELAARRGFFNANCLQRSLTLWWLLKREGLHGDLKIGVRLQQQQCEAHAWVEYQGCVLNDSTDVGKRFAPFAGAIFTAETEFQ